MKRRLYAIFCLAALALAVCGCSKEADPTTLTGFVLSVEGTVVTLRQFDANTQPGGNRENFQGQRPSGFGDEQRPESNYTRPEGDFVRPEGDFVRPEGDFTRPEEGESLTRPQGDFDPGAFEGTLPEDAPAPSMPADGIRPGLGDDQGETTTVDLANAHISIQDGDIKAAGSIADIKVGSFLTVTLNAKGEATEVLVTEVTGFGGGGFGGNRGNRGEKGQSNDPSNEQSA